MLSTILPFLSFSSYFNLFQAITDLQILLYAKVNNSETRFSELLINATKIETYYLIIRVMHECKNVLFYPTSCKFVYNLSTCCSSVAVGAQLGGRLERPLYSPWRCIW